MVTWGYVFHSLGFVVMLVRGTIAECILSFDAYTHWGQKMILLGLIFSCIAQTWRR